MENNNNLSDKNPIKIRTIRDRKGKEIYSWDDHILLKNCYTNSISCPIYGLCRTYSHKRVIEYNFEREKIRNKKYRNRRCITMNSRGFGYQPYF